MKVQCDCGQFYAEIKGTRPSSPGRFVCYCDDCQTYAHYLGRKDILDPFGGSEIIPVYPGETKILGGQNHLLCIRLSPKGMYRWSTQCCHTPMANTKSGFPWLGLSARTFLNASSDSLEQTFGEIRGRVQGRFAQGQPPKGTSEQFGFRDTLFVLPFILKGFILKKHKNSPFFQTDGKTPIAEPTVLTLEKRQQLLVQIFDKKYE